MGTPRPPITLDDLSRIDLDKPPLVLFTIDTAGKREFKQQVTVFGINDNEQTVVVRIRYQNYCAVSVPDHFGQRELDAFTNSVLGSKKKAFAGRTELFKDGQNLCGYLRYSKFIIIYHDEVSTPRWLLNKFLEPVDISRCKHQLGISEDEFSFPIFEANLTVEKRLATIHKINAGAWFEVPGDAYTIVMSTRARQELRANQYKTIITDECPNFSDDVAKHIRDFVYDDVLRCPSYEPSRTGAVRGIPYVRDSITSCQMEIVVHDSNLIKHRPDITKIPVLRVLSIDGEMSAKSRLFPDPTKADDCNISIGVYMDYRNKGRNQIEPAVLSIFQCRNAAEEAEARARGKVHIYPCGPMEPITWEQFVADEFNGMAETPGAREAYIYRKAQSRITREQFLQEFEGNALEFEAAWEKRKWEMVQASERRMLHCKAVIYKQFDPDIVLTYNGDIFDWPFWYKSAEKLGILEKRAVSEYSNFEVWAIPDVLLARSGQPQFGRFSRFTNEVCQLVAANFSSSAKGNQESFKVEMSGRWHIDLLKDVRDSFTLPSYALEEVAKHFLKQRKLEISPMELMNAFDFGTKEQKQQVLEYCGQDCRLLVKLIDFFSTTAKYTEIARNTLLNVSPLIHNGQQQRLYQLLLNECISPENERRFFIPTRAREEHETEVDSIECLDFHWDVDEKVDEDLGLDWKELNAIEDPVQRTKEAARKRAEIRQLRGDAIVGEQRPFSFKCPPNMPMSDYMSVSQQLSELSTKAQQDAKIEKQDKSKAKTAKKNKKSFPGAIQMPPVRGLHIKPTNTLDFNSMYPKIIIFFNLSFETYLTLDDLKKHPHLKPRIWRPPVWNEEKKQFERAIITGDYWEFTLANGETVRFLASAEHSPHGFQGVLPRLLLKLLAARKVAKKDMAIAKEAMDAIKEEIKTLEKQKTKAKSDYADAKEQLKASELSDARRKELLAKLEEYSATYINANQRQGALKIVANSGYGFTGARHGILPQPAIAAVVTFIGVKLLLAMKMILEKTYDGRDADHPFVKICYGDTDSLFPQYNQPQEIEQEHKETQASIIKALDSSEEADTRSADHFQEWVTEFISLGRLRKMFLFDDDALKAWLAEAAINDSAQVSLIKLQKLARRVMQIEHLLFSVKHGAESAELVNYLLNGAGIVELEKVCDPWMLVSKKRYAYIKLMIESLLKNGKIKTGLEVYKLANKIIDVGTLEISGLSNKRRDSCMLVHEVMDTFFEEVFRNHDLASAYKRVRSLLQELYNYDTPIHKLLLSKKLAAHYDSDKHPHYQVALKKKRRSAGSEPPVGSRVPYYMREVPYGTLKTWEKDKRMQELAEDPEYGIHHDVIYNAQWYKDRQLTKPLMEVFMWASYGHLIPEGEKKTGKLFKEYAKMAKDKIFGGLNKVKRFSSCPETRKEMAEKGGVRQFFNTLPVCQLCPVPTSAVVCHRCRQFVDQRLDIMVDKLVETRERERVSWLKCYDCPATGGDFAKAKLCEAFTCPNFSLRKTESMHAVGLQDKIRAMRDLPPVPASELAPPPNIKKAKAPRPHIQIAMEVDVDPKKTSKGIPDIGAEFFGGKKKARAEYRQLTLKF